jgi:hypothetical protein
MRGNHRACCDKGTYGEVFYMGPEKMVHFYRLVSGTKISSVGAFKLGVFHKLVWYTV